MRYDISDDLTVSKCIVQRNIANDGFSLKWEQLFCNAQSAPERTAKDKTERYMRTFFLVADLWWMC